MDATSTTRAGTEPVDLSGVPETMLPLCARARHTLSPRPRFQDRDAVTLVSRLDHDVAAARTGRPTAEGTARALTQHLPVLRARRAPRPRTGGRAEPVAELVTCTNPRPRTGGGARQHRGSGTGVPSRPCIGGRGCWGSPSRHMAAVSRPCTGCWADLTGLYSAATGLRPRTGGRDQGPVTGQTGERP